MKTKLLMLVLGLMLGTASINDANAQHHRPYRHCSPHVGVIVAPPLVIVPGPVYRGACRPHRVWIEGHWRYNRYGQARWVPPHWRMV